MDKLYFEPKEIAEALGVTHATVLNWIKSGKLEAINMGKGEKKGRYLVSRQGLLNLSAKNILKHMGVEL